MSAMHVLQGQSQHVNQNKKQSQNKPNLIRPDHLPLFDDDNFIVRCRKSHEFMLIQRYANTISHISALLFLFIFIIFFNKC